MQDDKAVPPLRYRRRNRFRPARCRPRAANLRIRLLSRLLTRQAIITNIARKWRLTNCVISAAPPRQANFRFRALGTTGRRVFGKSSDIRRKSALGNADRCNCNVAVDARARARVHLSPCDYFTFSLGVIIGKFNDYVKTLSSAIAILSNNIMCITYYTERRYISVAWV